VLQPGDTLQLGRPQGVGYLAVAGGLLTPPMLGSRATYARAGLGGVGGRALAAGDRLPCALCGSPQHALQAAPLLHRDGPIRVIPGPQADHFTPAALASFYGEPWVLTPARDRMGLRLAGPRLAHVPGGADIVSDGVTPAPSRCPPTASPSCCWPTARPSAATPRSPP
jgi:allophanate hydrolase